MSEMNEEGAKRLRNEKRSALIAEAGLTLPEVLSATVFMQLKHANPSFDEALAFTKSIKAKFPEDDLSEIFAAGLLLMDVGWLDDPSFKDMEDLGQRIYAKVDLTICPYDKERGIPSGCNTANLCKMMNKCLKREAANSPEFTRN